MKYLKASTNYRLYSTHNHKWLIKKRALKLFWITIFVSEHYAVVSERFEHLQEHDT